MIELINLKKQFDDKVVTKDVTLKINSNKMTVIIGRSGEGKSVLLKQIIGLIPPTSGKILVDGVDTTHLTRQERLENFHKFGYVFQFAALLDSLTVFENIGISLFEKNVEHEKIYKQVKEKLSLVDLPEDVMKKYPSELSGGMRKRVGLARTLIRDPQVLLYDEPTTGLDPITTKIIHKLMKSLQDKFKVTSVVISHDLEVFNYADYIALLYDGEIKYFGDAKTVHKSDNPYIQQFISASTTGPIQTEIPHTSEDK
ncbi:ATP-binding cassette domain-containing protein [bacterium]|nr:ATP-binding cassette domain-containing protein [bacterium]